MVQRRLGRLWPASLMSRTDLGRNRVYRVAATGVVTLVVRGATTVVGLVSIPLLGQYLGAERLGLWLTLSTFLSWGGLADFGLALSLTNAVAAAYARGDRAAAGEAVSSSFFLLAALGMLIALAVVLAHPAIPWARVFNVTGIQAREDAGSAALIGLLCFAIRLPLNVPGQVFMGHQEGYVYLCWVGLGTMAGLVGLLLGIALQAPLPALVAAYFWTSLLGDVGAGAHLFWRHRTYLRPCWRSFSRSVALVLLRRGLALWVASASAVLFLQIDLLLVVQLFGATVAATYGTALRVVALIGAIQIAFIHPLWPSYSDAMTRGELSWIRTTFAYSIRVSLLWAVPLGLAALVAGPTVIQAMVHSTEPVPIILIVAIVLTEIVNAVARCISTLLNGLGRMRSQVIFVPLGIVVNVTLSIVLSGIIGPAGVAISTGLCLVIFWIGIMGRDAARTLNRLAAT